LKEFEEKSKSSFASGNLADKPVKTILGEPQLGSFMENYTKPDNIFYTSKIGELNLNPINSNPQPPSSFTFGKAYAAPKMPIAIFKFGAILETQDEWEKKSV